MRFTKLDKYIIVFTALLAVFAIGVLTGTASKDAAFSLEVLATEPVPVETEAGEADEEYAGPSTGARINLNTAGIEELMELDGMGEVLAGRIIEYREANGGFNTVEEITQVKGIGEKTFERIRDYITVD